MRNFFHTEIEYTINKPIMSKYILFINIIYNICMYLFMYNVQHTGTIQHSIRALLPYII